MIRCTLLTAVALLGLSAIHAQAAQFDVEQDADGVTVKVNGQLFTRYLVKSGAKPILFPVVGPSGKEMTRGYPMREAQATEKEDHQHHRSFWFTHGDVNGIDYWTEGENHGNIVHREFLTVRGGERTVIATRNDWIAPNGDKHCEDIRYFTFGANDVARWVDCDVIVMASYGPVKFGDTKEGSFGVRVAGSMRQELENGGTIVNSEGVKDGDAWGKRAAWVDYYGPVEGETLGVAIMNHPKSLRFPTYWHVRTYGLFTANPFGWHDFLKDDKVDGSLNLEQGEAFRLRHRVLFHEGDTEQAKVAEMYKQYAETP